MNNKRAKKLRKIGYSIAVGDAEDFPTHYYMDKQFMRKSRVYAADGTYKEVDSYPVRTIFLAKCKRIYYKRIKKKDREFQDALIKLL